MLFSSQPRRLSASERRYIAAKRSAYVRRRNSSLRRNAIVSGIVCAALCVLTALAVRDHLAIVLTMWGTLAAVFGLWSTIEERRASQRLISAYDHVLATGECSAREVHASRVWAFEEQEDEGACYAFQRTAGDVLFVLGQDFYESSKFPAADFELIDFTDQYGDVFEMLIVSHGPKLKPARTIPAAEKERLNIPDHGALMPGTLEDVLTQIQRT